MMLNNRFVGGVLVSKARFMLLAALISLFSGLLIGQPSQAQPATVNAPKAYVGVFKDNAIAVIDTGTNKVVKTIPVPVGPHGLVMTLDGHFVYVSSDGDTKVSVIDTTTDTIVNTIEVGKAPNGLTLTSDGKQLLVAVFGAGQVVFIDTTTNKIVGQVAVPSPHNTAVSPDGKIAYVSANYAADPNIPTTLAILDVAARTKIGDVTLAQTSQIARTLNFSPDGKTLYFTQVGVNAVQVLDTASNKITAQIPTGAAPHHVMFTPAGNSLLVVSQMANELALIDPKTNAITVKIPVGQKPHWIATTSDGAVAYVTNENGNSVSVVNLYTQAVVATIAVGNAPRKIVVQPTANNAAATAQNTMVATALSSN
jgi:YVTN family beta-propeller protein